MWHWFSLMSTVLSSHICLSFTCGNWQTPNLLESPLDAGTSDTSASLHQPVLADCLTGTWQSTVACSTTPNRTHGEFRFFTQRVQKTLLGHQKTQKSLYFNVKISHIYLILVETFCCCFSPLIPFPLFFAFRVASLSSLKLHWFCFTGFLLFS